MSKPFDCPLWKGALSLESGLRRRLCCHDETGSSESFTGDLSNFEILDNVKKTSAQGAIPENCKGCFSIEENGGYSPRNYYQDFFNENQSSSDTLKYIDITFENICNLSCFSCKPIYSSKIDNEFRKLEIPFKSTGLNASEFKERFDSFKSLALSKISNRSLVVVSGGEPAISKNVKDFLDDLSEIEHANTLTLRVFSNLTLPADWILKYISKFKRVEFVISIDAVEDRAEYIRFPSRWDAIDKNFNDLIDKTTSHKNFEVNVHSVLSILNFDHIPRLINYFNSSKLSLFPSFTLLSSPTIYMIENLPKDKLLSFQKSNLDYLDSISISPSNQKRLQDLKSLIQGLKSSQDNQLLELILHHRKLDTLRKTALLDEIAYLR